MVKFGQFGKKFLTGCRPEVLTQSKPPAQTLRARDLLG